MIESIAPPPPPRQPENSTVREILERYNACYSYQWEKARVARFTAEKAIRESSPQRSADQARAAALAYVHSRQALMTCIVDLEKASRATAIGSRDRAIIEDRLKAMRWGYFGQIKYETAILIGLLDKEAAVTEESYEYPYATCFCH